MYSHILNQLKANGQLFKGLFAKVTEEEYLWKQQPGKWCLLEILCHLYDEEREDFRARTAHILKHPDKPLPPINPSGWVTERDYLNWDFEKTCRNFLMERAQAVNWLNSLKNPNWEHAYIHKKFGPMTANMLLSNWLAHDYLHIKQILKLKYDYLKHLSSENLNYAGGW